MDKHLALVSHKPRLNPKVTMRSIQICVRERKKKQNYSEFVAISLWRGNPLTCGIVAVPDICTNEIANNGECITHFCVKQVIK